jgi:hypothetical protein
MSAGAGGGLEALTRSLLVSALILNLTACLSSSFRGDVPERVNAEMDRRDLGNDPRANPYLRRAVHRAARPAIGEL